MCFAEEMGVCRVLRVNPKFANFSRLSWRKPSITNKMNPEELMPHEIWKMIIVAVLEPCDMFIAKRWKEGLMIRLTCKKFNEWLTELMKADKLCPTFRDCFYSVIVRNALVYDRGVAFIERAIEENNFTVTCPHDNPINFANIQLFFNYNLLFGTDKTWHDFSKSRNSLYPSNPAAIETIMVSASIRHCSMMRFIECAINFYDLVKWDVNSSTLYYSCLVCAACSEEDLEPLERIFRWGLKILSDGFLWFMLTVIFSRTFEMLNLWTGNSVVIGFANELDRVFFARIEDLLKVHHVYTHWISWLSSVDTSPGLIAMFNAITLRVCCTCIPNDKTRKEIIHEVGVLFKRDSAICLFQLLGASKRKLDAICGVEE